MNTKERKARFTEIMTSVELLGDPDDDGYNPTLPNGTQGFGDSQMKMALLSQIVRMDDEAFLGNMLNALAKTGFDALANRVISEEQPTDDDLGCVTMALHTAWAIGAYTPLALMMGQSAKFISDLEIEVPDEFLMILRPNAGVREGASKEDPIALLEDNAVEDLLNRIIKEMKNDDDNE